MKFAKVADEFGAGHPPEIAEHCERRQRLAPTRGPNYIERLRAPGVKDSAVVVGAVDLANCTTTVDSIQESTPTGPAYCTWVALGSNNPGYDTDARPSR